MPPNIKQAYLSAADPETSFFTEPGEFGRSLALNLLFQPNGVFVPDIFCFLPPVADHVFASGTTSMFVAAIAKGYLDVAVRYPDIQSFRQLLQRLRADGIVGIHHRAEDIANQLDSAVDALSRLPFRPWPEESVGQQFAARLRKALDREPDLNRPDLTRKQRRFLQQFLTCSRPWRKDTFDEAESIRQAANDVGMRRGELLRIIARKLRLGDLPKTDSIDMLLKVCSPLHFEYLRCYWKLVTQCYQINQARCLGGNPSVSSFDWQSDFFLSDLLLEGYSDDRAAVARFDVRLRVPDTAALQALPISDLVNLKGDEIANYFAALRSWEAEPTDENAKKVETAAQEYAKRLVTQLSKGQGAWDVSAQFWKAATKSTTRRVLSGVAGVAVAGASLIPTVGPFVPVLAAAGSAGLVIWKTVLPKTEEAKLVGVRPPKGVAEITVPVRTEPPREW